jgi:hypothetical protein
LPIAAHCRTATVIFSSPAPQLGQRRKSMSKTRSSNRPRGLSLGNETLPGFDPVGRFGLVAQKSTPRAMIDAVSRAAIAAGKDPEVQTKLTDLGAYPLPVGPAELRAFLREEADLWARVIKEAGIERE